MSGFDADLDVVLLLPLRTRSLLIKVKCSEVPHGDLDRSRSSVVVLEAEAYPRVSRVRKDRMMGKRA
jgi:hypothetical protein